VNGDGNAEPDNGDALICSDCAAPLILDIGEDRSYVGVRVATEEELKELSKDQGFLYYLLAVRALIERTKSETQ
jgi:hypothetical protein